MCGAGLCFFFLFIGGGFTSGSLWFGLLFVSCCVNLLKQRGIWCILL